MTASRDVGRAAMRAQSAEQSDNADAVERTQSRSRDASETFTRLKEQARRSARHETQALIMCENQTSGTEGR